MSRVYCSDAARLRGDDNTATAARIDVWILVELPGTWGRDPINDAAIPAPVVANLRRACKQIPRSRLVFIRRRETYSGCRIYVIRSAPELRQTMLDLPSIHEVANVPFVRISRQSDLGSRQSDLVSRQSAVGSRQESPGSGQGSSGGGQEDSSQPDGGAGWRPSADCRLPTADCPGPAPAARPLVLVCTHGQHDSCCGRRGYPLYDALRQRAELDVWQCSHVGGDRFAANAVVLPRGIYYGPVEAREADALTASLVGDDIYLSAYRGRCSLSRVEQAAETFVRRATGLLGADALHVLHREALGAERTRVQLAGNDGIEYQVTVEQYAISEALLTCTAGAVFPIPQFRLIEMEQQPIA